MAVSLTLAFPLGGGFKEEHFAALGFLAYTRIRLEDEPKLFEHIVALPSKPMPIGIDWYDDTGITPETEDRYGRPLRFVLAKDLGSLADCHHANYFYCELRINNAALKFANMINPETPVVLYWH